MIANEIGGLGIAVVNASVMQFREKLGATRVEFNGVIEMVVLSTPEIAFAGILEDQEIT